MIFLKKILANKFYIRILLGVVILVAIFSFFNMKHRHSNYEKQQLELPEIITSEEEASEQNDGWVTMRPRRGDTLGKIFIRAGLSQTTLYKILEKNPHAKLFARIAPNQEIRFQIQDKNLMQMILPIDTLQFITVTKEKHGFKNGKIFKFNAGLNYIVRIH